MTRLSIFLVGVLTCCQLMADVFKPQNLTVGEFFKNPIGNSLEDLTMSWQMPLLKNGTAQSAYRILVASSPDSFDKPVWDSGRIESSDSVKVAYQGKLPASRERLYWKVKVWNEDGVESEWSDIAFFEAGLQFNSDWQAEWIFTPEEIRNLYKSKHTDKTGIWKYKWRKGVPPTYLRKTFETKKPIKARLYIATRGIFYAYINGKKVADEYWGTGWTYFDKRIQSNTYDVSELIQNGKNAIALEIGDGWYAGRIVAHMPHFQKRPEALAQLELTYADGSTKTITTNSSWKTSFGAIQYSDIYDGEFYDATKEPEAWKNISFDDSQWQTVATKKLGKTPLIEPRRNQPIVVKDILVPISVKEVSAGAYIFDFGQNMVGNPVIKIPASAKVKGQRITVRFAEMLDNDGTMYTANYRSAMSTDYYTCKGGSFAEIYEPKFTFHGYRYVEISGFPKGTKVTKDWIVSKVLYNDMQSTGTFVCSEPKINKLQSNIQWGQRGNYFSVPTDCPQRDERMGWTGDAQVFCPTGTYNMNVNAFFAKWCIDMLDSQSEAGEYQHVAPCGWGTKGGPAWSDAGVIIPWTIYLAYNDKKILAQNYNGMAKWVDFVKRTSTDYIRPDVGHGDWLQPSVTKGSIYTHSHLWRGTTPRQLIGTAYFARCADIMSETAKILGKEKDIQYYAEMAKKIRSAFAKKFVNSEGIVATNSQTGYILTLAFDILPEKDRQKVFDNFVKKLASDKYYLDTGFVGTPLLTQVLSKFGRHDLAYRILTNEGYPSWIYSINQGATTIWERWNSYTHDGKFGEVSMNSFNHYAYGAIGAWMYENIGGLWNADVAYKKIRFAPKLEGNFKFATARCETPYGTAESSWKIEDGKMFWKLTIPANSGGIVTLPTKNPNLASINGEKVKSTNFELPSGIYEIVINL